MEDVNVFSAEFILQEIFWISCVIIVLYVDFKHLKD